MDDTLALIKRAQKGDKAARDVLFEQNTGLIYSVIQRFSGRGIEKDDLFQIGSIGLLKAMDRFDPGFDVRFSTYAVPMIAGEIRRFLRDDGMMKVSRSIKENQYRIYLIQQELWKKSGREPSFSEILECTELSREELILAMETQKEVESLQKTVYEGEGKDVLLEEKIPEEKNQQEGLLNRIFLEQLLRKVSSEERKLIYLRYFSDQTQTEIAKKLGISQVQVSRLERKILKKLREMSG